MGGICLDFEFMLFMQPMACRCFQGMWIGFYFRCLFVCLCSRFFFFFFFFFFSEVEYVKTQKDDSPFYLFDHCFGEYPATKNLVSQYSVPSIFGEDTGCIFGFQTPQKKAAKSMKALLDK